MQALGSPIKSGGCGPDTAVRWPHIVVKDKMQKNKYGPRHTGVKCERQAMNEIRSRAIFQADSPRRLQSSAHDDLHILFASFSLGTPCVHGERGH